MLLGNAGVQISPPASQFFFILILAVPKADDAWQRGSSNLPPAALFPPPGMNNPYIAPPPTISLTAPDGMRESMFEQDVVKPGYILGFILALLGLSWLLAAVVASGLLPLSWLALLPFIPGLLALLLLSLEGHPLEVHARPLLHPVTPASVLFAVAYPLLLVGIAAFVALGTSLGYLDTGPGTDTGILAGLIVAAVAFLSALPASLGQEYGYRCYLLPALTYWQGRTMATLLSGVVWGLATAPVAWFVFTATGSGDPLALALLGFLLLVAIAFAFSCCAALSASVLPVTLMNALLLLAVPATFSASLDPRMAAEGGLVGLTWPSPLPLLLLVALAFVPVFAWLFAETDGAMDGSSL
jgi:hypothetical protein